MFVSLDGIDGSGKSTQVALLADWAEQLGKPCVRFRDPGTTKLGEAVRDILLNSKGIDISPRTETLLYMAARAQLVAEVIRPALAAGKWVISDRFLLANVAYQAHGRELNAEELWRIGEFATDGVRPDLSIVVDVPVEVARVRMNRPKDRMESAEDGFLERVRQGFLLEAARDPQRIHVLSGIGSPQEIHEQITRFVESKFPSECRGLT